MQFAFRRKTIQKLVLERQGEFSLVTIPELEGWEGGWLKIPASKQYYAGLCHG